MPRICLILSRPALLIDGPRPPGRIPARDSDFFKIAIGPLPLLPAVPAGTGSVQSFSHNP